jgi:hypothetical protein
MSLVNMGLVNNVVIFPIFRIIILLNKQEYSHRQNYFQLKIPSPRMGLASSAVIFLILRIKILLVKNIPPPPNSSELFKLRNIHSEYGACEQCRLFFYLTFWN